MRRDNVTSASRSSSSDGPVNDEGLADTGHVAATCQVGNSCFGVLAASALAPAVPAAAPTAAPPAAAATDEVGAHPRAASLSHPQTSLLGMA